MDLTARLAEHVYALHTTGLTDASGAASWVPDLARGLEQLGREVSALVRSCLAVSLVLTLPAGEVTVGLLAPAPRAALARREAVQASLAVPLRGIELPAVLLLQAADEGAFLLLADDLDRRLARGHGVLLDRHLGPPAGTADPAFTARLADLRAVDQAVGALIEQGWLPDQAHQQLRSRAAAEQLEVPALARGLLADLHPPDDPAGV